MSTSGSIAAKDVQRWAAVLSQMKTIAKERISMRVLEGVLLEPMEFHGAPHIRLSVTNLQIGHVVELPGKLDSPCVMECAVAAKFFASIKNPTAVTLSIEKDAAHLRTSVSRAVGDAWDADEFPLIPKPKSASTTRLVSTLRLYTALAAVWPAIGIGFWDTILEYACLHWLGNEALQVVASDTHRIHTYEVQSTGPAGHLLLKADAVTYLTRGLKRPAAENTSLVQISHTGDGRDPIHLTRGNERWCVMTRMDPYVAYQKHIPTNLFPWFSCNAADLSNAVMDVMDKDVGLVSLQLHNDAVAVESSLGAHEMVCTPLGTNTPNTPILFNGRLILQGLRSLAKNTVAVSRQTEVHKAIVLSCGYFQCILMPVTIDPPKAPLPTATTAGS